MIHLTRAGELLFFVRAAAAPLVSFNLVRIQTMKVSEITRVSAIYWPIFTTFSKGIRGALALNFGQSGGANCERSCRHHPIHFQAGGARAGEDGECYAAEVERRGDRAPLADKLGRHEALPAADIVGRAIVEVSAMFLRGISVPWFRFSTNGALPGRAAALADRRFIPLLRELLSTLGKHKTPIHFPVESAGKAEFYRETIGDLATVRESIQTPDMSADTIATHSIPAGPCSFTAGESVGAGPNKRGRILVAAAAAAAAWAKLTGRKTIVCPAVRVSFISRTKAGRGSRSLEQVAEWRNNAKCGSCTACANKTYDIVYPAH